MDNLIDINDKHISYSDIGRGKAIVFLHGWGTSKDVYSDLIKRLSNRYRCIGIDLPGFGNSDGFERISISKMSILIHRVLQKLKINKYSLVGHSLGGAISLIFASKYQRDVEKLILISPLISFKQFSDYFLYFIKNLPPFLIAKLLHFKKPNLRLVNAFRLVYLLSNFDLYGVLGKVRKDILIIYGSKDQFLSLKPLEPMFGVLNNIHLSIFEDVRHFVVSYNQSDLAGKIDLFLANKNG